MKIWLAIIVILASLTQCNRSDIRDSVEQKLEDYPNSTLQDLYKSYFQDYFGPGHMIQDTSAAMRYLEYELGLDDYTDTILLDPTGYRGHFYRVNLVLIKNGTIPKDEFFNLFIRSVNSVEGISMEEWKMEWADILEEIKPYADQLQRFESDREYIDSLIKAGEYVVHHSELFLETYHPHYRIIHRDLFDQHLKKYLGN